MATYDRSFVLGEIRKQHPEFKDTPDSALTQALAEEVGGEPDAVIQALGEEFVRSGIKPPKPYQPTFNDIMDVAGQMSQFTPAGPVGPMLANTVQQTVGDVQSASRLPKTLGPALTGKATPAQLEDARHGVAGIGGLAGGIAGGMLGGPAGAEAGGPIGAALVGGAVSGALGGGLYSVLRDPNQSPIKTGFDTMLGAAFGTVMGGLLAGEPKPTTQALAKSVTPIEATEPHAVALPETPPQAQLEKPITPAAGEPTIRPATEPNSFAGRPLGFETNKVVQKIEPLMRDVPPPPVGSDIPADMRATTPWSRVGRESDELDLNKVVGNARAPEELAPVMEEGSKRATLTHDQQAFLKAQDIVRTAMKSIKKTEWFSGRRRDLLNKQFSDAEQADMSFFRERTGNPYVPGDSPEAAAARLSPEAKDAVRQVGQVLDHAHDVLKNSGYMEDLGFVENYLSHLWVGKLKFIQNVARKFVKTASFSKARTFATIEDGMKAGLVPRTVKIGDLLQFYENMAGRVIATNRMVEALKVTPSSTGDPLLVAVKDAPQGYRAISHPVLGGTMAVHPDAHPMVNFALQEPMRGTFPTLMTTLNAYAKKAALSFSLFHHLTLTEQGAGALAFTKPKYFLPPMVIEAAGKGLKLLDDPAMAEELLDARVNLSAPGDVQTGVVRRGLQDMEARTRQMPGLGQLTHAVRSINDIWDDVLWNRYYNGLKAYTYYELKDHYLRTRPDVPEAQVRAELGEAINNIYGGQNWDDLFGRFIVDPQTQQAMHWAMLAPDWTLSNMAAATQAVSKRPIVGAVGRRALVGHALYVFTSTQLLNYVFTSMKGGGHFSWDNDPGHKWDVELPWHDPKGRKLYMSIGKSIKEVVRWFTEPIQQLGAKVAPVPQAITEQLTGYTTSGFPTSFNPQRMEAEGVDPNLINQMQARVLDLTEKVMPFAFRGNNAFMAFPLSEGMTPYKTIQMYEAALRDHDYARIAVISQHAKENNINVGLTFRLAERNVKKFQRAGMRASRALDQQIQQEQGHASPSR